MHFFSFIYVTAAAILLCTLNNHEDLGSFYSLCSAGGSSSSATVFPSHIIPAPATSQVMVFSSHSTLAPAC